MYLGATTFDAYDGHMVPLEVMPIEGTTIRAPSWRWGVTLDKELLSWDSILLVIIPCQTTRTTDVQCERA